MPTTLNSAPKGNHSRGLVGSVLVAIFAASLVTALLIAGRWSTATELEVGQPAPASLRTSPFQPDSAGNNPEGALVVSRGEIVTPSVAEFATNLERPNFSFGFTLWLALWVAFVLWSLVREPYARAQRTRQKFATVLFITLSSAVFLGITLTSSVALVALPVGLVGILVRQRSSQPTALASALLSALTVSLLVPFDLVFFCVILVQAIGPALLLPRAASPIRQLGTGFGVGLATALAYLVAYYGSWSSIPISAFGQSGALAAVAGGLVGSILALFLRPFFSWMSGDVSLRTLSKLERFSQPLLKQLADQAPGSWQHSLAVARLCESAGAAIGADIPLLRVGAYYHDLGKTKRPKYFIENNSGGEHSIHQKIKASDSRDAIFEHVTHGIQVAKDNGLPLRIIDFIRTHHGAAQLEFFWSKELESGNAKRQSAEDFSYPGTTPQCPETAILCICDAVEAATRNGEATDEDELSDIVYQILFGKVRDHQLNQCGLGLPQLQRIHLALTTTLVQAHAKAVLKGHPVDVLSTAQQRPRPKSHLPASLSTIRLDSQDKPSNDWQSESQKIQNDTDTSALHSNPAMAFNETLAVTVPNSDGIATDEMNAKPEDRASLSSDSPDSDVAENSALLSTVELSRPGSEPAEAKAMPAEIKANPAEIEAKPTEAKAKPTEAKPTEAEMDEVLEGSEVRAEALVLASEPILLGTPKSHPSERTFDKLTPPPSNPSSSERLNEWQDALDATSVARTPIPMEAISPTRNRPPAPPRATIPLGQADESPDHATATSKRADSQDGLRPGEMVIGPPPSTHPERSRSRSRPLEDVTVRRAVPMPTEAMRPSDSPDEELTFTSPLMAGPFVTRERKKPPTKA